MDHRNLDGLIDGLDGEMSSFFGDSKKDWRSIWDRIKEIGAAFKETRYPTRDEKDRAWSRFQSVVEHVRVTIGIRDLYEILSGVHHPLISSWSCILFGI